MLRFYFIILFYNNFISPLRLSIINNFLFYFYKKDIY
ncbi:hypothetical protein PTD2_10664 [Pseudoalteromonas tunicata D2]|uniref:Uncharacterized protein n=1 Tax=Pseudoalteromonas tunicata D2 TaxID=87626 RepID=A4C5L7_9GAMM|nr:hypothetical protein PTD2_10664 [Pseudoalteromonas tunicata D2]